MSTTARAHAFFTDPKDEVPALGDKIDRPYASEAVMVAIRHAIKKKRNRKDGSMAAMPVV